MATIGALRLNQHYPWMIPVAHLAIFVAFGLALELFERTKPDAARRVSSLVLGSLVIPRAAPDDPGPEHDRLHPAGVRDRLEPGPPAVPLSARIPEGRPRQPGADGGGLLLLVVGRHAQLAVATHHEARKPAAAGSPNVLLLVLDTVRAKSLGLYGAKRATSPNIDRLAGTGVTFAEARSTAPWTLPSHAGMFTGRWPGELFRYHEQRLDPSVPTLAGYLGRNGYATAGFVANTFYCNSGFGLSSGFDHYEDFDKISRVSPTEILRNAEVGRRLIALVGDDQVAKSVERKDADRINADFLRWLPERSDRPFFAFLNYMDAHAPYAAAADGRHFGLRATTPAEVEAMARWHELEYVPDDPRTTELAVDSYDDCIAHLDDALGEQVTLREERVTLDRHPVDRPVGAVGTDAFRERTHRRDRHQRGGRGRQGCASGRGDRPAQGHEPAHRDREGQRAADRGRGGRRHEGGRHHDRDHAGTRAEHPALSLPTL